MSVTFINCFEVPAEAEEEFLALWREVNAYAQSRPGYLGHTLHRSLAAGARYRFVNVARWASAEHFQAATDEHFRTLVTKPGWERFVSVPGLYDVLDEGSPFP